MLFHAYNFCWKIPKLRKMSVMCASTVIQHHFNDDWFHMRNSLAKGAIYWSFLKMCMQYLSCWLVLYFFFRFSPWCVVGIPKMFLALGLYSQMASWLQAWLDRFQRGWSCISRHCNHRLGQIQTQIHPSYKSHNTLDEYPTMHFVTEMCTHVHISVTKWCIVG